jgi:hypothetical protein
MVRQALGNVGYTFNILSDEWATVLEGGAKGAAAAAKMGLETGFEDLNADGIMEKYVVDPITGMHIQIPPVDSGEFTRSIQAAADAAREGAKTIQEIFDVVSPTDTPMSAQQQQGIKKLWEDEYGYDVDDPTKGKTGAATEIPGIPPVSEFAKRAEEGGRAYITELNKVMAAGFASDVQVADALKPIAETAATNFATAFGTALGPAMATAMSTALSGGGEPTTGPSAQTVGGGGGPFDAQFEGYATSAANKFSETLGPLMQEALSSALSGPAQQGGEGMEAGAPAGAFDQTFVGYATSAAAKFKETLTTEMGTALTEVLSTMATGGEPASGPSATTVGGGAGPFDTAFQGYGTSAAQAFKTGLSEALPTAIQEALSSGTISGTNAGATAAVDMPFFQYISTQFKGYATRAAEAFGLELQTQLPLAIQSAMTAVGTGGEPAGAPSAGTVGGGTGPFDQAFIGYATSAANAFKTTLGPLIQAAISEAMTGGGAAPESSEVLPQGEAAGDGMQAGDGGGIVPQGGAAPTGAAPAAGGGGPFAATFTTYAQQAATAFQTALSTALPTAIQAAISAASGGGGGAPASAIPGQGGAAPAGGGGGGPFDAMFTGYATGAATAFGTTLSSQLPPKVTAAAQAAVQAFAGVMTGFVAIVGQYATAVVTTWTAGLVALTGASTTAAQAAVQAFAGVMTGFPSIVGQFATAAVTAWTTGFTPITAEAQAIATAMVQAVSERMSGLATVASQFGSTTAQNFNSGIAEISQAVTTVETAMSSIDAAMAGASANAHGYGLAVGEQFAQGIMDSMPAVDAAAAELAARMPSSPAEKGPLSKEISFDYIVDALKSAMERLPESTHPYLEALIDRMGDFSQKMEDRWNEIRDKANSAREAMSKDYAAAGDMANKLATATTAEPTSEITTTKSNTGATVNGQSTASESGNVSELSSDGTTTTGGTSSGTSTSGLGSSGSAAGSALAPSQSCVKLCNDSTSAIGSSVGESVTNGIGGSGVGQTMSDAATTTENAATTAEGAAVTSQNAAATTVGATETVSEAAKTTEQAATTASECAKVADSAATTAEGAAVTADGAARTAERTSRVANDMGKIGAWIGEKGTDAAATAAGAAGTLETLTRADADRQAVYERLLTELEQRKEEGLITQRGYEAILGAYKRMFEDVSAQLEDQSAAAEDSAKTAEEQTKATEETTKTAEEQTKATKEVSRATGDIANETASQCKCDDTPTTESDNVTGGGDSTAGSGSGEEEEPPKWKGPRPAETSTGPMPKNFDPDFFAKVRKYRETKTQRLFDLKNAESGAVPPVKGANKEDTGTTTTTDTTTTDTSTGTTTTTTTTSTTGTTTGGLTTVASHPTASPTSSVAPPNSRDMTKLNNLGGPMMSGEKSGSKLVEPIMVTINSIDIKSEADVRKLVAELDKLLGDRIQLNNRGQKPTDDVYRQ